MGVQRLVGSSGPAGMAFVVVVLAGLAVVAFTSTKDVDERSWRIGMRVMFLVFIALFLAVAIANYSDLEWSPPE